MRRKAVLRVLSSERSFMDVTFVTPEGTFNYRVCAVIVHDNHLLAM